MQVYRFITSVLLISAPLTSAWPGDSGKLQPPLDAPVHDRMVVGPDLPSALAKVASDFKIPMVIEWIVEPKEKPIQTSLATGKVYDLISAVVKSQPGYAVEVTSGVVHVFNQRFVHDPQNFLNLKLINFERERAPAFLVDIDLRALARETAFPPAPSPPPSGLPGGPGGIGGSRLVSTDEPDITLKLRNVTFREALEILAREADDGIWVVSFVRTSEHPATGFLGTRSWWGGTDSEEPGWDSFRWGHDIPPLKSSKSNILR